MRLLVFLAVLVCVSGQCPNNCEDELFRVDRTGCRFHCHLDINQDGTITLQEIQTRFGELATDGRVSYEPFRDRFMNVTRMCVTEARRCFDDFATSGENTNPDFIEERDVLQIWDDIRLVAGDPDAEDIDLDQFMDSWIPLYFLILEDDQCDEGKR